jgi:hypothetical protein
MGRYRSFDATGAGRSATERQFQFTFGVIRLNHFSDHIDFGPSRSTFIMWNARLVV